MSQALSSSSSSGPDVDLQFRTCKYGYTAVAGLEASAWITAGLVLLGLAERGSLAHVEVILLRYSAWMLFEFSHKLIGIGDLRCLAVLGLEGPQGISACLGHCQCPHRLRANALERGLPTCGPLFGPIVFSMALLAVYAVLFAIWIGDEHQHLGIVLVYLIGNLAMIPLVESVIGRLVTPLNPAYVMATGGPCLGFAIVGFFALTSGFALLQRHASRWMAIFIPPVLTAYEVLGGRAVGNVVATELAEKEDVRQTYASTRQGLYASCIIGLLNALAECARLTLLLCDAGAGDKSGEAWMVVIPATFIWNVTMRIGCVYYLVSLLPFKTKLKVAAIDLLRLDMMYTMGYARYFGVLSVVVARACIGNPMVPAGQERLAVVFLAQLFEEALEDVAVKVLNCCGVTAVGMSGGLTEHSDDVIQAMAERRLVVKKAKERKAKKNTIRDLNAVVPIADDDQECEDSEALEAEIKLVRARLAFLFAADSFAGQPYWSHFCICIVAQFHMVLLLIIFANGVPFVLGFCPEQGYKGIRRGIVTWSLQDEATICSLP